MKGPSSSSSSFFWITIPVLALIVCWLMILDPSLAWTQRSYPFTSRLPTTKRSFSSGSSTSSSNTQLYQVRSVAKNILGRFRKKRPVMIDDADDDMKNQLIAVIDPIAIGKKLPAIDIEVLRTIIPPSSSTRTTKETSSSSSSSGVVVEAIPMTAQEVVGDKSKVIVLGMPGAFTPTCTKEHLPGYIKSMKQFNQYGITKIIVITTNDRYVNEAWGTQYGLGDPNDPSTDFITYVSDGDGDLVRALGLAEDMGFGVGIRSKRFALVVDKGIVQQVFTDEGMNTCTSTSAESLLKIVRPNSALDDGTMAQEIDIKVIGSGILAVIALIVGLQFSNGGGGGNDNSSRVSSSKTTTTNTNTRTPSASSSSSPSSKFTLLDQYR